MRGSVLLLLGVSHDRQRVVACEAGQRRRAGGRV